MLSRTQRLSSGDALHQTVRTGLRAGSASMVVHWRAGSEPLRVGFIVSKAVGTAVARNRVKRRLRHLVSEEWQCLPPGGELVVRAQPAAQASSPGALAGDLVRCAERVQGKAAA